MSFYILMTMISVTMPSKDLLDSAVSFSIPMSEIIPWPWPWPCPGPWPFYWDQLVPHTILISQGCTFRGGGGAEGPLLESLSGDVGEGRGVTDCKGWGEGDNSPTRVGQTGPGKNASYSPIEECIVAKSQVEILRLFEKLWVWSKPEAWLKRQCYDIFYPPNVFH